MHRYLTISIGNAGDGIDVFVLHPSPVDTNFYSSDTAHKSASLSLFKKTANSPASIADDIFRTIGNFTGTIIVMCVLLRQY